MVRRSAHPVLVMLTLAVAFDRFGSTALALHTQSPPVTQVTQQTSGDVGKSAAWGDVVWAFRASGDSLGNGNRTPELFMYEHDLRVLGGALGLSQVTCGGFQPDNPSIATASFGSVFAFDAVGTLCADGRNNCVPPFDASSPSRQIFAYYPETGQIRQLTRCPGDCVNPSLAENARMVAFESASDVLGTNGGNPLAVTHVFQGNLRALGSTCSLLPCSPGGFDRGVKDLTPIGGGRNAAQNFSGRYVAFESDGDPLNDGANPGTPHVYVLDVSKNLLQQVPPGSPLPARNPALDQSGKRVVYEIDVPRPGPPASVVTEIFFSKLRGNRDPKTMSLTPGADGNSFAPSLGPTGKRVSFTSSADLLHHQAAGNQMYDYALKGSHYDAKYLLQVTGGPGGVTSSVQSTGWLAGFASSDDFIGNGNTIPQFFVANLHKRAPGSVLSPLPGTPTPRPTATPLPTGTPVVGVPASISLTLVTNQAINNGDNTLTTVIAATVVDFFGNPVPDGILVDMSVAPPASGIVVGDGFTNQDPQCDVSSFEQETGVPIQNRPGVAHVCVTYPGGFAGTSHAFAAAAGPKRCVGGGTPGTSCDSNDDCAAIHRCSVHTETICDQLNGNADCPAGETCDRLDGTCESSGEGGDALVLPSPVNDCTVNGAPCSDGNPCTLNDVCGGGTNKCVGGDNPGTSCTQDGQCTGGGHCQVPTCQPGTPKSCPNDNNACTNDTCNFFTGQCGTPVTCLDDGNPCTDDVCDPATGTCGVPNVAACSDDDPCTVGDECANSACVPGPQMTCPDDGNSCTLDQCNPQNGTCGIRYDPCACSAP